MDLSDLNERQYYVLSRLDSIGYMKYKKDKRPEYIELRRLYKKEICFLVDNDLVLDLWCFGEYHVCLKGVEIIGQKLMQDFSEHMKKSPVCINGFSEFEKWLPINK